VAAADFNGDGKPDLAVSLNGGTTVVVLLGNGDGTFQGAKTSAGLGQSSVTVADLNGDGRPDLILATKYEHFLDLLLGNGDGTFQPPRTISANGGGLYVAVADVNGDGNLDLAVGNSSTNTASIILGNGDGTFQPQRTFATDRRPVSIVAADLNGDHQPDLVTANLRASDLSVLLNTSSPGLQQSTGSLTQTVNQGTTTIALTSSENPSRTDNGILIGSEAEGYTALGQYLIDAVAANIPLPMIDSPAGTTVTDRVRPPEGHLSISNAREQVSAPLLDFIPARATNRPVDRQGGDDLDNATLDRFFSRPWE
jgi:hypothetical protein